MSHVFFFLFPSVNIIHQQVFQNSELHQKLIIVAVKKRKKQVSEEKKVYFIQYSCNERNLSKSFFFALL